MKGGKGGDQSEPHPTNPDAVTLPPYLPDHPALRQDWARYLDDWKATDREVAAILTRLDREGLLANTAIFFLTNHGISHLRAKQFLYDDGLHIPLLVRLPTQSSAGTRRTDLVSHPDIAATSLARKTITAAIHLLEPQRPRCGWSARPIRPRIGRVYQNRECSNERTLV